jgi:lysophospholipase L1-like esterase
MMINASRVWIAAVLAATILFLPQAEAQPKDKLSKNCQVPPWVTETDIALPYAEQRVKRDRQIRIVTLGSSSTKGSGGSGPPAAWPAQLETLLAKRMPGIKLTVLNKAEMRQSVPDMLARLDRDVLAEKPDLVIWEAGTFEAVRGGDVDILTQGLMTGIDRITATKADVILMDMQYARNTARIINFQPYVEAMERAATMRNLFVFPRFEIMRDWVENEQVTFEGMSQGDAVKTADQVYACLGKFMAELLANSLK